MLRQGWCHFGGICGRLPVPWGRPGRAETCRCGFWLSGVPCLGTVSCSLRFQGDPGSASGSVRSRRFCVFPRRWAFDETYWRCGISLANKARRGMRNINSLLSICKNKAVKKHRLLKRNPDQKYGDILEILVIDCESNFEALWLSCDQNANKKKMLHQ